MYAADFNFDDPQVDEYRKLNLAGHSSASDFIVGNSRGTSVIRKRNSVIFRSYRKIKKGLNKGRSNSIAAFCTVPVIRNADRCNSYSKPSEVEGQGSPDNISCAESEYFGTPQLDSAELSGSRLSVDGKSDVNSKTSKENVSNESHSRSSSPKPQSKVSRHERKPSNQSAGGSKIQNVASSVWSASIKFISPTYKTRSEEFKKLFTVPESDKFVIDYSCALQKDILVHGRMYLSLGNVCFYANILKWETCFAISLKDITSVTKEKTAKVIPNAIQICTKSNEKLFFTSFAHRDKTFLILFRMWQYCLLDEPLSPAELWAWIQDGYNDGDEASQSEDNPDEDKIADPSVINDLRGLANEYGTFNSPIPLVTSSTPLRTAYNAGLCDNGDGSSIPLLETDDGSPDGGYSGSNSGAVIGVTVSDASCNDNDQVSFSVGYNNGRSTPIPIPVPSAGTSAGDIGGKGMETTPSLPAMVDGNKNLSVTAAAMRCKSSSDIPRSPQRKKKAQEPSAQLPMDEPSESSENDGDGTCPCSTHHGKEMLDSVFPVSVDQLFLFLFSDSAFYRDLCAHRKVSDIVLSDWSKDKAGTQNRQLTYTISLNHPMGPKTSAVSEKQTMMKSSKPGKLYIIKSEVQNYHIPYADTFYVLNTFCLSRISANRCRLRVHGGVLYRKSCWGIVKNFIEKNAHVGMQEYFTELESRLRDECDRFGLAPAARTDSSSAGSGLRNRHRSRRKSDQSSEARLSATSRGQTAAESRGSLPSPVFPSEVECLAKAILVILLLMLFLNATLFYKLWFLENEFAKTRSDNIASFDPTYDSDFLELKLILQKVELTKEDWLQVFQKEQHLHRRSVQKWSNLIGKTMNTIEQMESSLRDLRSEIRVAQVNAQSYVSASDSTFMNNPTVAPPGVEQSGDSVASMGDSDNREPLVDPKS